MIRKIQNNEFFSDCLFADDRNIWIISTGQNYLQEIDRKSGFVTDCAFIPTRRNELIPYRVLFKYGNCLYIIPYRESTIKIYDLEKREFSEWNCESGVLDENQNCGFIGYSIYNDKVFLYSTNEKIVLIDLKTGSASRIDLKPCRIKAGFSDEFLFLWNYSFFEDGYFVLIPENHLCLIKVDPENGNVCIDPINESIVLNGMLDSPYYDSNGLLFVDRKNNDTGVEITIAGQNNDINRIRLDVSSSMNGRAFGYVGCYDDKYLLLPGVLDKAFVLNAEDFSVSQIQGVPVIDARMLSKTDFPRELNYRNGFMTPDHHLIAVHGFSSSIIDIDIKTMSVSVKDIVINDFDRRKEMFFKSNGVLNENMKGDLSILIDMAKAFW